jgi:molybdopterin-guanine dinucleotide biosynthesis protein A
MSAAGRQVSGVVMVGGKSTRMGRDKARLLFEGRPLWKRQVQVLRAAGASPVFLSLRPRQRSFSGAALEVRDRTAGKGPISGLASALRACSTPFLAVLAVDMPYVDSGWFRRLLYRCRPGVGAVVRGPRGYEPLAAVYPREALNVCETLIGRDCLSLQDLEEALLRRRLMRAIPARPTDAKLLRNWNTPADVQAVS